MSQPSATSLAACRARATRTIPCAPCARFVLPEGVVYLDGNSLGALPRGAAERVAQALQQEWGQGLIRSWNSAGWIDLPQRVGDKIARLIGASPGTVVATDSTSVNVFKVLSAALHIAAQDAPARRVLLSERSNFPTDLYIAQALCRERGYELVLTEPEALGARLEAGGVAVLLLTHVNYRSGSMFDMAGLTAQAQRAGALTVWDLAHSAGAVPLQVEAANADFAVGCGYKFLNGGPGAPAFVWAHPRHADRVQQPLSGWLGHAAPFAFSPDYRPAPGIQRYLCGTPPILSLVALDCGVDSVLAAAEVVPGQDAMASLRAKSLALGDLFIELVEAHCAGHGLTLITPRTSALRGSQVSLARAEGAFAIMQALIARGVIGDFRTGDGGQHPDILRFGLTPLYTGFEDVWHAVDHLRQVLTSGEWQRPEFNLMRAVT